METLAADLQMKKAAEKKRLENENNFRRQILGLEKELEELDEQGIFFVCVCFCLTALIIDVLFSMKERNASSELIEIDMKLKEIAPLGTALAQRKHQVAEEIRNLRYEINGNRE